MAFVRIVIIGTIFFGWPEIFTANAQPLLTDAVRRQNIEDKKPTVARYVANHRDWIVSCAEQECRLTTSAESESFARIEDDTNLLGIVRKGAAGRVLFFNLPLRILLARTPVLSVDGRAVGNLSFRTCHERGCIIPVELSPTLFRQFQKGNAATLKIHDLQGEPHLLTYSLLGFTKAYADAERISIAQ